MPSGSIRSVVVVVFAITIDPVRSASGMKQVETLPKNQKTVAAIATLEPHARLQVALFFIFIYSTSLQIFDLNTSKVSPSNTQQRSSEKATILQQNLGIPTQADNHNDIRHTPPMIDAKALEDCAVRKNASMGKLSG